MLTITCKDHSLILVLPAEGVCLNARYKDGQDHIGEHRDDEKELDPLCPIASVSLGAARDFVFRHRDARGKESRRQIEPVKLELAHGSLLLMNQPTNTFWYHSLPVRKKVLFPRINLTFRRILLDNKKWEVYGTSTEETWLWGPILGWVLDRGLNGQTCWGICKLTCWELAVKEFAYVILNQSSEKWQVLVECRPCRLHLTVCITDCSSTLTEHWTLGHCNMCKKWHFVL